tara:strand:+ start:422 stop:550 length:129 start_codon:yes stop_codon:yes gene_type:complete
MAAIGCCDRDRCGGGDSVPLPSNRPVARVAAARSRRQRPLIV